MAILDDRAAGNLTLIGDLVLAQDFMGRVFLYHFEQPHARIELVNPQDNLQASVFSSFLPSSC